VLVVNAKVFHGQSGASIVPRYANLSGNSGVVAYQVGADSITVEFSNRRFYLYTNESAGADNVAHMKRLAAQGQGLSAFISAVVKDSYAERW
jgi:hypothetical protein